MSNISSQFNKLFGRNLVVLSGNIDNINNVFTMHSNSIIKKDVRELIIKATDLKDANIAILLTDEYNIGHLLPIRGIGEQVVNKSFVTYLADNRVFVYCLAPYFCDRYFTEYFTIDKPVTPDVTSSWSESTADDDKVDTIISKSIVCSDCEVYQRCKIKHKSEICKILKEIKVTNDSVFTKIDEYSIGKFDFRKLVYSSVNVAKDELITDEMKNDYCAIMTYLPACLIYIPEIIKLISVDKHTALIDIIERSGPHFPIHVFIAFIIYLKNDKLGKIEKLYEAKKKMIDGLKIALSNLA